MSGRGVGLGAALAVCGVALTAFALPFELDERLGLGALYALRGVRAAPDTVTVVAISERAAEEIGQPKRLTEWRRTAHAELVDRLRACGAAVIVFDLFFEGSRSAADDAELAAAIERAGNVVLVAHLEEPLPEERAGGRHWTEPPVSVLDRAAAGTAEFALPLFDDIRTPRYWTFGPGHDGGPTLPFLAAQVYLADAYDDLAAALARSRPEVAAAVPATHAALLESGAVGAAMRRIRDAFVNDPGLVRALHAHAQRLPERRRAGFRSLLDLYASGHDRHFNFYGPARTVRTIDYDAALRGECSVAGHAVFVGFADPYRPERGDKFGTPYSTADSTLSGVELAATAFANLIDHSAVDELSLGEYRAVVAAAGLLLGLLIVRLPLAGAAAAGVGLGAAYAAFAAWQFAAFALWWPLVIPVGAQLPLGLGAAFVLRLGQLRAQRERVRRALSRYVPEPVVERLSRETAGDGRAREVLHGTCLLTDAQNYTRVAEGLAPEDVAKLLDDYYATLFAVVARHGGVVSDAGGDSMVAVWPSAEPDPLGRARACRAAVEIVAAADAFNARRGESALPTRVALESGRMALGNVGSEQRLEYRAIGDIVNTASRIEGLNRVLGTRVLASAAAIADTDCPVRELGTFLLRGKAVPVVVYELRERAPSARDTALDAGFGAALEAFRAGRWDEARARFAALAAEFPDDGPARYYAELAQRFAAEPPADWHGVVSITTK